MDWKMIKNMIIVILLLVVYNDSRAETISTCIDINTHKIVQAQFMSGKSYIIFDGHRYDDRGAISRDVQGIIMYHSEEDGLLSLYVSPEKIRFVHMSHENKIDAVYACEKGKG